MRLSPYSLIGIASFNLSSSAYPNSNLFEINDIKLNNNYVEKKNYYYKIQYIYKQYH